MTEGTMKFRNLLSQLRPLAGFNVFIAVINTLLQDWSFSMTPEEMESPFFFYFFVALFGIIFVNLFASILPIILWCIYKFLGKYLYPKIIFRLFALSSLVYWIMMFSVVNMPA